MASFRTVFCKMTSHIQKLSFISTTMVVCSTGGVVLTPPVFLYSQVKNDIMDFKPTGGVTGGLKATPPVH